MYRSDSGEPAKFKQNNNNNNRRGTTCSTAETNRRSLSSLNRSSEDVMSNSDSNNNNNNNGLAPESTLSHSGIQVYVRVRPFSQRELEQETPNTLTSSSSSPPSVLRPIIDVEDDRRSLVLYHDASSEAERGTFQFDLCISPFHSGIKFDKQASPSSSDDEEDEAEASQNEMYSLVGVPILQASWAGFNGCVFAYGQTNSGKTYTMMGTKREPGIIPRLCRQLFERLEEQAELEQNRGKSTSTTVHVTYMEIYNEQVKDLLRPKPKAAPRFQSRFDTHSDHDYQTLKVRQHPLHGPFVEGITRTEVRSWLECVKVLRTGNENRAQAATGMNDHSSRSHAIFQVVVTHTEAFGAKCRGKNMTNHKVSKLNLVDLAGSERLDKTGVSGKHLAEATAINQSLSTLRKVVDALIHNTRAKQTTGAKAVVVPYRESLLTVILADNFGGNSKTIMIATVSPAASSLAETESTLRYATLTRGIVNRVKVNEDPSAKLIRELQSQLKSLQDEMVQVRHGTYTSMPEEARQVVQDERLKELQERVDINERAMEELQSREDSLRQEMQAYKEREKRLLKTHDELKKGEEYWKRRAEQLTQESEQLREELRKERTSREEAAVAKVIGLRESKEDRSLFWLDDPDVFGGSIDTPADASRATSPPPPPSFIPDSLLSPPATTTATLVPQPSIHVYAVGNDISEDFKNDSSTNSNSFINAASASSTTPNCERRDSAGSPSPKFGRRANTTGEIVTSEPHLRPSRESLTPTPKRQVMLDDDKDRDRELVSASGARVSSPLLSAGLRSRLQTSRNASSTSSGGVKGVAPGNDALDQFLAEPVNRKRSNP
eukprot:PhM_4_TR528/c0_g2_i1/m.106191/K17914/KIF13; kinesin family member 13